MARVTAEDCLLRIPSPFILARTAAKRARQLSRGASSQLATDEHKYTVIALHEIACGLITASVLDEPDLPRLDPPQLGIDLLDNSNY